MRIAMMGTRGVPACYGGFETCVEEVGSRLVERGHDVTVYCRRGYGAVRGGAPSEYKGMRLVYQPAMRKRSLETLSHTALSAAHAVRERGTDAALMFNAANAPFLPALRAAGIPCAIHVDGLEWQRAKWKGMGQSYYRMVEALSVRWADALIADAQGIADYYQSEFGAASRLITYGAPRVERDPDGVETLGLTPDGYHLVVARFEPENHVLEIVRGYAASAAKLPLVVVGSAPYSPGYTAAIHVAADNRVRLLGGVWDQKLLDQLYANAYVYWHGHSVGGTNPSLLRALGAGAPVNAFDVSFNREVAGSAGVFWSSPAEIAEQLVVAEEDAADVGRRRKLAAKEALRYDWDTVTSGYESLCLDLALGTAAVPGVVQPSGRRVPTIVAEGANRRRWSH